MYKYLGGHMLSFLLVKDIAVEFLDLSKYMFEFKGNGHLFFRVVLLFHILRL